MATKKNRERSTYLKVGKGQTTILIPEPLPSDSNDGVVETLFNEESELGPATKSDNVSEVHISMPDLSCSGKGPKRKLDLEFEALSHTTPKRKSDNFKQLQNFWENKSGGKSVNKPALKTSATEVMNDVEFEYGAKEVYESPIDKTRKKFDETRKKFAENLFHETSQTKSADQVCLDYTQVIENVVNNREVAPEKSLEDEVEKSVYDFNEDDNPSERISLKDFRQSDGDSPMRAVTKSAVKSLCVFDPKVFHVNKSKNKTTEKIVPSPLNSKNNARKLVSSAVKKFESSPGPVDQNLSMPPPSSIPKCLSVKKGVAARQRRTSMSFSGPGPRQRLFEDDECSPSALTPPSPEVGKKRKRVGKTRLLSMEPCNYSQLFSPPELADQKRKTVVTKSFIEDDSNTSLDSQSNVSLTSVSEIRPVCDQENTEISESSILQPPSVIKDRSVMEKDSFFDLSCSTEPTCHENGRIDIRNLSVIENCMDDQGGSKSVLNCSALSTPEIVKVSIGRKSLILEKQQTTLNETLISEADESVDQSCWKPEVADVVTGLVGKYLETDQSDQSENEEVVNKNPEKRSVSLEICDDGRIGEVLPELCGHNVSISDLTSFHDTDYNSDSSVEMEEREEVSYAEINQESSDTDTETAEGSINVENDYILNSPQPLQIDLPALDDLNSFTGNEVVKVTENIAYKASEDILDLSAVGHSSLCQNSYLSVPVNIAVEKSTDLDLNDTDSKRCANEPMVLKSEIMDPCYSPDLRCSESPTFSSSLGSGRNLRYWSPSLTNLDSEIDESESDIESESSYDYNESDTENKAPLLLTKRKNLKRRLEFDSSDKSSDVSSPSAKVQKTPLANRVKSVTESPFNENGDTVETESDCDMISLSEIDINGMLESSCVSDEEYPESLNSSSAYCSSFMFWSPGSSVETNIQWSPTSSLETDIQLSPRSSVGTDIQLSPRSSVESSIQLSTVGSVQTDIHLSPTSSLETYIQMSPASSVVSTQNDGISTSASASSSEYSELETYPVYTQSGPTHLLPCFDVPEEPLDLSLNSDKKCDNPVVESNVVSSDSDWTESNSLGDSNSDVAANSMQAWYEPICISEPRVATLDQNSSEVWKEIDVGSVSYCYEPSEEAIQYSNDCYNNAVYGPPVNQIFFAKKLGLISSVTLSYGDENNLAVLQDRYKLHSEFSSGHIPAIEGLTIPLQNIDNSIDRGLTIPTVPGLTVPLQSPDSLLNSELIQNPVPSISESTQNNQEINKFSACYYGDKSLPTDNSKDGYGSTATSGDGSSSDSENDLVKMMDMSVRNKLKKKAGRRYISQSDESFELIDTLKGVRPYVISGWISSTYLTALARKSDLVNDMFDNALNEKGEIHEWIVENCRITTPAVLARDLLFRLFTLEELKNLNLNLLARKKRFKAIRKCVESQFPNKVNKNVWTRSCLGLIKSSVKTLFKHRVRHVQNYFVMHAACV